VLAFVVPRDTVELTGNWDVMGLRGTGSFDYTIPEQFVEEGRTFWLFDGEPRSGGGVYRLGVVGFAGIGHAGWALGVAQRALDEIQQILASGRARIGGGELREDQVIQRTFSQQLLALRSARLLVHDTIGRMVRILDGGDPMTKAMQDELVSAVAYETNVCLEVVRWAYMTSGSAGLRNPSVLQRCYRDMSVGAAHLYVDPRCLDEMGKGLLGATP
jgi:alkylation response protein AidB-like acyl-CoA dehydrogenase